MFLVARNEDNVKWSNVIKNEYYAKHCWVKYGTKMTKEMIELNVNVNQCNDIKMNGNENEMKFMNRMELVNKGYNYLHEIEYDSDPQSSNDIYNHTFIKEK